MFRVVNYDYEQVRELSDKELAQFVLNGGKICVTILSFDKLWFIYFYIKFFCFKYIIKSNLMK